MERQRIARRTGHVVLMAILSAGCGQAGIEGGRIGGMGQAVGRAKL
ncbi:hypothetical protein GbCGDNIH2_7014 [Granulibacter bethesdensis]|uniref:Lipoprotein n=1 Tax=Granulibacter bethesdensis (strain ATCC BAA-1260 / CGDNIH1) TaxID=391165 RepID=A0A286M2U6_GRABC|nr:hypothetical protein GbCGDNIH2_7014 [Granulibacter bethesdensis]APH50906.1 hypothetical protein GbCGDNIH5_7014 [Granulibacter bethesdensis]APH63601.1 hypothetical protein GbCGDNIH1I4_7014 [Granulibacter bethesdensis]ASV62345.1 hypothetical protein GbCGDNIH1_7014 [Granulibacter bethesdensis CGDNIH1]